MGFSNYFKRFISDFSNVAFPLNSLLGKDKPFIWTQACEDAFEKIKSLLKEKVLTLPEPDKGDQYIIKCDASKVGLGAALFVKREVVKPNSDVKTTVELPVAFASRTLNSTEQRYSNTDREGLAVVWAVDTFEHYTFGHHFECIIETDHSPLIQLFKRGALTGRFARYAYALHSYDFTLRHKPGKEHSVPDYLSRQGHERDTPSMPANAVDDDPSAIRFGDRAYREPITPEYIAPDVTTTEHILLSTREPCYLPGAMFGNNCEPNRSGTETEISSINVTTDTSDLHIDDAKLSPTKIFISVLVCLIRLRISLYLVYCLTIYFFFFFRMKIKRFFKL